MLTTLDLLDKLKAHHGSDYKTAKLLNIPNSRVSQLRRQEGIFTDAQALIVAKELGLKEEYVIASLVAERSKNSPAYSILQRIADRFERPKSAAAIVFGTLLFLSIYAPLPGLTA